MLRKTEKNLLKSAAANLQLTFEERRVANLKRGPRLLFLCGANKENGAPSERRKALKEFLAHQHPDIFVVLAENVYHSLADKKSTDNLLDLEQTISFLADHIVIVLEGYGAFCELGAFAHADFRSKVSIVNDSAFQNSRSFINDGCISAIRAANSHESILHYPMDSDGVEYLDRIADIFEPFDAIFQHPSRHKRKSLTLEEVKPTGKPTRDKALFLYDLLWMCGPISYRRLIEVLKSIFGDNEDYRLPKELLAILIAIGLIGRHQDVNTPVFRRPFLHYSSAAADLAISFRLWNVRRQANEQREE